MPTVFITRDGVAKREIEEKEWLDSSLSKKGWMLVDQEMLARIDVIIAEKERVKQEEKITTQKLNVVNQIDELLVKRFSIQQWQLDDSLKKMLDRQGDLDQIDTKIKALVNNYSESESVPANTASSEIKTE